MSSTNRGAERAPNDFYETPPEAVEPILDQIEDAIYYGESGDFRVIDAGCGTGAISRVIRKRCPDSFICGIDIDPRNEAAALHHLSAFRAGDFLEPCLGIEDLARGQVVVMNPPYSLALEFIERGLELAGPGGHVFALVRLGFLASRKRQAFWQSRCADMVVLSKRPSFCWTYTFRLRCPSCGATRKVVKSTPVGGVVPAFDPPACVGLACSRWFVIDEVAKSATDSADYCWVIFGPLADSSWRVS